MIDVNKFLTTYQGKKNRHWSRMLRDQEILKSWRNIGEYADEVVGKLILGHAYGIGYAREFKFWIDRNYGFGILPSPEERIEVSVA